MSTAIRLAGLGVIAGLAGCGDCSTVQANAPSHEAAFGGAFGEGHDPCDEGGAYMITAEALAASLEEPAQTTLPEAGTLIVFGAPFPALLFAWFDTVEEGASYARIEQTMDGEAGWLEDEQGWMGATDWDPDLEMWFRNDAVVLDPAVLSAGRVTITKATGPDDEGFERYEVEGNLVWGNPADAGAAWYSWEGKDVWSLHE